MNRATIAEQRVFQSWLDYQDALMRAVAPLATDQLQHRVLPGRRTAGEIAEHIVFGRALHLTRELGEAAHSVTPYLSWETSDGSRSAAQIVDGLDVTWQVIVAVIMRGSPTDDFATEAERLATQAVWGLLDHDLPHAGQLSMVLRASGLPGVEI